MQLLSLHSGSKDHFGNSFEILRNNPGAKLLCGVDVVFHAEKEGFGTIRDGTVELMVKSPISSFWTKVLSLCCEA